MNSPGHRASILNPAYNCFGGARHGDMWAQEFGQGQGCPVPNCGSARLMRRAGEVKTEIGEPFAVVFESGNEEYEGAEEKEATIEA